MTIHTDLVSRDQCAMQEAAAPDRYGKHTTDPTDPDLIPCRWVDEEKEFTDDEGKKQISRAKVYLDRAVPKGSYLAPVSTNSAGEIVAEDFHRVHRCRKIPNYNNTENLFIVYLI